MKTCFKCGESKPITEFYKHKRMADGHLGKCKACTKSDVATNYRDNHEAKQEYERERFQRPDRKRKIAEYQRRLRRKYPDKYRARRAVRRAMLSGVLRRQPCEVCGLKTSEAHHEDYSKPLQVRWLCRRHHRAAEGRSVLDE